MIHGISSSLTVKHLTQTCYSHIHNNCSLQWRFPSPIQASTAYVTNSTLVYVGAKPNICQDCFVINLCLGHVSDPVMSALCAPTNVAGFPSYQKSDAVLAFSIQTDSQAQTPPPSMSVLTFGYQSSDFSKEFHLSNC